MPENYISALETLLESKKSEAKLALVNKKQEEEIHYLQNLFQVGRLHHSSASKIGDNGVKPDTWYVLNANGEFEEADG
ncbi:hypothetical protein [Sodalis glossinidius]|uniref:hypothetical protein n=1 Tax=Sodalis glossinidius TaxID=63612 RepID=UPI0002F90584|nr:hypothetical protein [Sodalis glossinidius]